MITVSTLSTRKNTITAASKFVNNTASWVYSSRSILFFGPLKSCTKKMRRYDLRPRKPKPVRILPLFWYQLPADLLFHIGQLAAEQTCRYPLRSRIRAAGS